ncbi:hypothetical protein SAMN05660691_04051 [Rheinheimera pacifica]|uniref:Apea-like HEPN domain-containing protein n=1 Tax=Rheinheimera pacifica TaxID=173990 RepID=A0A1H6NIH7_9GAMM|nr:hypothetical protein [Rheinheimera pacifica]SEI13141.1 hypothetical protein SAMN05660691_04051 [Rheinheimera pacifica]
MNIHWDNKQPPDSLISDIKDYIKVGDDGRVSYTIGVEFQIDALFGKVIHRYELDDNVLYKNFHSAVMEAFQSSKLKKPDEILSIFKRKCDKSLSVKKKYYLLTSISLRNSFIPKRRTINNCIISFYKNIPAKYKKSRSELIEKHSELKLSEQKNYVFVVVSVIAPDVSTAFKIGINSLDVVRSILQIGFKKSIRFLSPQVQHKYSTNSILSLGQVHTLHTESGSAAFLNIWYEPDFTNKEASRIQNFPLTESNLTSWLNKLKRNPFRQHLLISLTSYINALDRSDQEFRFMKLWSVIEKLVNTDDTKMIIKRVSFFYDDRAVAREVLNSLRQARNVNVHAGVKPINVEMKNFTLCGFIEDLFRFFINNPFKYDNLQKVIDFISLPTELQSIDQQIQNLKAVKKFIGKG